jgi:acetylornithine deacetylase/succinyl-diaminopimelate desuccinylase-like protein
VTFGSDAPRLRQLAQGGTVALVGPGSIRLAHSPDERIDGRELADGLDLLLRLAPALLAAAGGAEAVR